MAREETRNRLDPPAMPKAFSCSGSCAGAPLARRSDSSAAIMPSRREPSAAGRRRGNSRCRENHSTTTLARRPTQICATIDRHEEGGDRAPSSVRKTIAIHGVTDHARQEEHEGVHDALHQRERHHVAVRDVAHLVGEHRFDLAAVHRCPAGTVLTATAPRRAAHPCEGVRLGDS